MNALIDTITTPGARKYLYRVTWAVLIALVASGKLDEGQLQAALGVVAAVLAVADSQTPTDTEIVSVVQEPEAQAAPELPAIDTRVSEAPADAWQTPVDTDWAPPQS